MITLTALNTRTFGTEKVEVVPTIFPDGTSQVWKLPETMLNKRFYGITWNFEHERELFYLCSLRKLLPEKATIDLHIPYLPYGRQDKKVSNYSTFNLHVFADIINSLGFAKVTSVDVHSIEANSLIKNFENIDVYHIHDKLIKSAKVNKVCFPDQGAHTRYRRFFHFELGIFVCEKVREQLTGEILETKLPEYVLIKENDHVLIIDDICDGGRTFVEVAKVIREKQPKVKISLFVTHGIFSKGKQLEGIDEIYTTNSLIKNFSGFEV